MEHKPEVGLRVSFKEGNEFIIGTILSVNREFIIVKFDNLNEITLLRKDRIMDLRIAEEVSVS